MRVDYAIAHGLGNRGGTTYRTPSGSTVGIAAATEVTPNRWFLGITPRLELDTMGLLCQSGNAVLDFVLPMTFSSDAWPRFSRSGGQVKFNVDRRDGSFIGFRSSRRWAAGHQPLSRAARSLDVGGARIVMERESRGTSVVRLGGVTHGWWCGGRTRPIPVACAGPVSSGLRCEHGSSVLFDELGSPWPVHGCHGHGARADSGRLADGHPASALEAQYSNWRRY